MSYFYLKKCSNKPLDVFWEKPCVRKRPSHIGDVVVVIVYCCCAYKNSASSFFKFSRCSLHLH